MDVETGIAISRGADLARAMLYVAAEDDLLVSHSLVLLPVDAFIARKLAKRERNVGEETVEEEGVCAPTCK